MSAYDRPRTTPKLKLAPVCLGNSTFQTQIQTLHSSCPDAWKTEAQQARAAWRQTQPKPCRRQGTKIGGIQSGHYLKNTRGFEPPQTHRSSGDKSRLNRNKHKHLEARASPKTRGLEQPPNSNWHPSSLDTSTFQTQFQTLHPSYPDAWKAPGLDRCPGQVDGCKEQIRKQERGQSSREP